MKKLNPIILFLIFVSATVVSQVVKTETLCSGMLYPVGIHNSGLPNDNRIFILEKRGRIKIANRLTGAVTATPFLDIYSRVYPITSAGDERGLLGLAFHPNYATNGYFYVNYINPAGKTIIARYQVSPFADTAFKYSEQIILSIHQPFSNHNGGNLMFGPDDGYLYIALGDGGSGGDPGNRAQNKDSLLGKTLRIDINNANPPYYFSAPGNPFYGATAGRDEIFDWGLRNHWRCSFDRLTHDLWTADVGQNQFEEINFRSHCDTVGHNYGWRCYEANTAYNTAGCQALSTYEAPVYLYSHSLGCSVTGGYVYRGAHEGGLFGKYLFTDYCQGRIWATEPNGSGGWTTSQLSQSTAQVNNNYSSWGEDVDGELYLAGVSNGRIYRVKDTACVPVAFIDAPDTLFICGGNQVTINAIKGTGLAYSWTILGGGAWSVTGGQGSSAMTALADADSSAIVWMSVSNGTCSTLSNSIVVIPNVALGGLDPLYCTFSPPDALTASLPGGTFSGPGMSGMTFNPNLAGAGTHTIYYTLADTISNCNYQASGCVHTDARTVMVSHCSGIEEKNNLHEVKVYPNPARSEFNVEFYSQAGLMLYLTVSDALGRIIFNSTIETIEGKQTIPLQLSDAEEGLYFLRMQTKQATSVEKIFVRE